MRLILHWLLSALSLIIVAHVVPGFELNGIKAALVAAIVIGFINSTLGLILKVLTFPFILATLGIFWFVINALMLLFASHLVSGFVVHSFGAAFIGAIVLSLVNIVLRSVFETRKETA